MKSLSDIRARIAARSHWRSLTAACVVGVLAPLAALADGAPDIPAAWRETAAPADLSLSAEIGAPQNYLSDTSKPRVAQSADVPAARGADKTNLAMSPEIWGAQKSYIIPALEIIGFDLLLNQFDRRYFGCCDFDTSLSSVRRNLRRSWVVDSDAFTVNSLGHPYQGSMYHGFARASGLNYWEASGYTFLGSIFWEIAGETTPPSKNDQVMSGIGGSFLGEPLFRMANLLLERGQSVPRPWRELLAAAVSPPTGFNRIAFGSRFDPIFPSRDPAYYSRLQMGVSATTQDQPGTTAEIKRNEALVDFSLDYGLPGKPGYSYTRPFDYFNFQAIASSANGLESVNTRGLLFGKDYEAGENYRGVWGLYGSYDYLAPQLFRVASTALSAGTTAQWTLTNLIELQGTGLLGVGYTGVGTIRGAANERDNRYGVAPQALLALRLIFGDRSSLDVTAREYFVSRLGSAGNDGHDNIARADASFTVRIHKQHGIAVKYLVTRRDSTFATLGERTQTRGTVGIFYTLLGHDRFGAVNWRQ